MRILKAQDLIEVDFKEGVNLDQIPYQFGNAVRNTVLTLKGTVTISSTAGTIAPTMNQNSPFNLYPYLLALFGTVTFTGKRLDGANGIQMNEVPAWFLWFEYFIATGFPLPVDDGGMLAAGFAPGDYDIEVTVPINHYDPLTPANQHSFTYFRPVQYNAKPFVQIKGGTLFQVGVIGTQQDDTVAITGETATGDLVYDLSDLTVTASSFLVPSLAISKNEKSADIAYEYLPLFGAKPSDFNQNNLAQLEVQQYIYMLTTNLANIGDATAKQESGANGILGAAVKGLIETDFGTDYYNKIYARDLRNQNSANFMKAGFVLPHGVYVLDTYGHSWDDWQKKTCLMEGLPSNIVNAGGIPAVGGTNFRIFHKTANLSASAKASVGKFPRFGTA